MMNYLRTGCLILLMGGLSLPAIADDEAPERARQSDSDSAAAGTVRAQDDDGRKAGLLLPAVQKVREAAATSDGVEPDEIDAANTARSKPGVEHEDIGTRGARQPDRGTTSQSRRRGAADSGSATVRRHSVQQMMVKLKPRGATLVATGTGGGTGPADKVAAPPTSSKYEIADCGTNASPMVCCHHESGDGSTCNMFKMLCENAGGTAQGDGTDATCSDWP